MKTAGSTLPVSSPTHVASNDPVPANRLPVIATRQAELRAQVGAQASSLGDPAARARIIDNALQYGFMNRLGMPTVKNILREFGVSASEVERVAGTRAQNPNPGSRDRLDRQGDAGGRHLLGGVTEPATRRLPFG